MSETLDALRRADRNRVAMVFSILPGLGHIFKGYKALGFALLLGNILVVFIAIWLSLATLGISIVVIPPLWFLGVAGSAYFVKDRRSGTPPPSIFNGQRS